jgi:hypothetical protein
MKNLEELYFQTLIFYSSSNKNILTTAADKFFAEFPSEISNFLAISASQDWIDIHGGKLWEVTHLNNRLSFAELTDLEAVSQRFQFQSLYDFKKFLIQDQLITKSELGETWKDPTGLIQTSDDYEFALSFLEFVPRLQARLSRPSILNVFANEARHRFFDCFFDHYWTAERKTILCYPSTSAIDFYDLILEQIRTTTKAKSLRELRKAVEIEIKQQQQPILFYIQQALHLKPSVVDELYDLTLRTQKCAFILFRTSSAVQDRLLELGASDICESWINECRTENQLEWLLGASHPVQREDLPEHLPLSLMTPTSSRQLSLRRSRLGRKRGWEMQGD